MKKRRSTAYMKTLQSKAAKYYFENPNTKIQDIADKFNITNERLSTAISKELKKRFDNSFDRRCSNY
tara:strand:+ start:96 stop:296 length:201 start_codon:yes stop_codon:yes gene_type:complete